MTPAAKNLFAVFSFAALQCTAAPARADTICLLIMGDSTTSVKWIYNNNAPASKNTKDEWSRIMRGRVAALRSPDLAEELKRRYPFFVRHVDFAEDVNPRTEWVRIEGPEDLAAFASRLEELTRAGSGKTHSFKAMTWAIDEVRNCPAKNGPAMRPVINFETDGTASDTRGMRGVGFDANGNYIDPPLQELLQKAYGLGIRVNALGIHGTTGMRPSDDDKINLQQVMRDNFRTPDGIVLIVSIAPAPVQAGSFTFSQSGPANSVEADFAGIYRIKLNEDFALNLENDPARARKLPTSPRRFAGLEHR